MSHEDEKPPKITKKSSRKSNVKILIDKFEGELWELCPLDGTHYRKKKDMQHHIAKCKKQFLKSPRKVECPFNPLHIINLMEVEQHIMTCPNRVTVLNSLYDFEPKRETFEGVAMEPLNVMPEIPDYWDKEDNPDCGYDPMDSTKFRTVLRQMPPNLSKSRKRAWKEKERQRWKWLAGETKEKCRSSPYPKPSDVKSDRAVVKTEDPGKDEGTMMQSIIDGLSGANIADPRDAMLKRINSRLKVLQMMETKLKEEKLELQRQVESYLASIVKTEENPDVNGDPRLAPKTSANNSDLQMSIDDHTSRILPDIMTSAMIR